MNKVVTLLLGLVLAGGVAATSPIPFVGLGSSGGSAVTDPTLIWSLDAERAENLVDACTVPATVTRATTKTRVNSSGLIESVAANTILRDYDPVTLAVKGFLIEVARTNLLLRSQEFDNASWGKTRCSVTANAVVSPDGGTNADKLIEDATAAATHVTTQSATVASGATVTISVFAKAGERTQIVMQENESGGGGSTRFNLSTGTVASGTGTITAYGNGWYRCAITATVPATTATLAIYMYNAATTYNGDGASGVYLWGAQLEAGAFPTSYIPTTTAAVTRNADIASLATSLITGVSGTTFSLYLEAVKGSPSAPAIGAFIGGAPGTDQADLRDSPGNASSIGNSGGANQWSLGATAWANGTTGKLALAVQANGIGFCFNGGAVQTDAVAAVPASVANLYIGHHNGTNQFNGYIRKLRLYNRRPPDAELQAMTTP